MIYIRPIQQSEVPAARGVILSVAYNIYGWGGTLEESIQHFESSGEFNDMEDVRSHYFDDNGLFLAVFDDAKLIGSGAIRKLDPETAELKRMWLLESYHGKGIGYQVITRLFEFARTQGYKHIFLQTGSEQTRAFTFYQKIGFREIPTYNDKPEEISMMLDL